MTLAQFLGGGLIISSLVLFSIGLPVQIYKNHKRKSTEGMSLPLFVLYFVNYLVWLSYGLMLMDWPIITPNIPAVIASAIIVVQFIIYRRK